MAKSVPFAIRALAAGLVFCTLACENGVSPTDTTIYVEAPFSFKVVADGHARTTIHGINGRVKIIGSTGIDSMTIAGQRRVGSFSAEDAEDHLDSLAVSVTDLGDSLRVTTLQPEDSDGRTYIVDYELTVPQDMELSITNINGNIEIEDIRDSLSLLTANGNILLDDIEGNTTAKVVNGIIVAEIALQPGGIAALSTVNGSIDLAIPTTTSAKLTAQLANGEIVTRHLTLLNEVRTERSLSGTLGEGDGLIALTTGNGNITVIGFQSIHL
jgi:hypothetical protein